MNEHAIEQLRKRFIKIAMAAFFAAITFMFFSVSLFSFLYSNHSISESLDFFIEVQGSYTSEDNEKSDNLSIQYNPISVFSSDIHNVDHYYVGVYEDGELVTYRSDVSDEEMTEYIQGVMEEILEDGKSVGRNNAYSYKMETNEDGQTVIAMVNVASLMNFRSQIIYLTMAVSFISLIIVFAFVVKFSKRAIASEIENNRRQQQFITNASHELKTPLAVIRANTELEEIMIGENQWTKSTLQQIDRMNNLIKNLVMITRSQEREDKTALETINVTEVVNKSLDPYESMVISEELTMTRHLEDCTFVADATKIEQLVTLLIDNAFKYCDPKGIIDVKLSTIKKNGIEIVVSNDYAEGKDVDYSKFFERFYRQDQSHNIDKGGYGIGLSIAENICEQYRGSIHVEWHEGRISFICHLY